MKFEFKSKKEARGIAANLRRIKKLIDTPEKWIKGEYEDHKNVHDALTDTETEIFSYCVIGAAREVAGPLELKTLFFLASMVPGGKRFKALSDEQYNKSLRTNSDVGSVMEDVYQYNDNRERTHKQMMAYLDRCIAKAATHAGNA